ncbi:hypothetical protein, partial [Staphylococcus warneri]|uniref:hypothetical protein n=1 Tax=Staphylococcus warneri TaxID=1292 RepID=UPI001C97F088
LQKFSKPNQQPIPNAKSPMHTPNKQPNPPQQSYPTLNPQVAQLPPKLHTAQKQLYQQPFAYNLLQNRIHQTTSEMTEFHTQQTKFFPIPPPLTPITQPSQQLNPKINKIPNTFT